MNRHEAQQFLEFPGLIGTALVTSNVLAVELTVDTADGAALVTVATARRDPNDAFDAEIGADLCLARALQALGRKLERRVSGRIKSVDDNARHAATVTRATRAEAVTAPDRAVRVTHV